MGEIVVNPGAIDALNNQIPNVNGSSVSLIIKTGGPIGVSDSIDPTTDNVTFDTPFPNSIVHVSAYCAQPHFNAFSTISIWNESVSGFKISQRNSASASMQIKWMAIGY